MDINFSKSRKKKSAPQRGLFFYVVAILLVALFESIYAASAAYAPCMTVAHKEFKAGLDGIRICSIHCKESAAAAVNQIGIFFADDSSKAAVFVFNDHMCRDTFVADVAATEHLGIGKFAANWYEPAMAGIKRNAHDGIVQHPHDVIHVGIAFVTKHRKAVAFAQQQTALSGNAV